MFREEKSYFKKGRLIVFVIVVCLFWLALEINLFRLQIIKHEMFSKAAQSQYTKKIELPARRGSIYDRNRFVLATNILHYDLAADPKMVQHKRQLASKCATVLGKSYAHYLSLLNHDKNFVYLERRLPENEISGILKFNDIGLIKAKNFRRSYPYKQYAAHLIGFTDIDDRGLSGLEKQFEDTLRGEHGEAFLQYDASRRISYNADQPIVWPVDGANLILTLDKTIQTIVEQELVNGIMEVRGKAGMAVVMDPSNGEILALANYPQFNPNKQQNYDNDAKRNRVIADVLEPGSTLKIFSAATLLQENLKNRKDIIFCENGRYKLAKHIFSDTSPHGWLSFSDVIVKSSNIGVIKLVEDLPSSTLFKYLINFGFNAPTGIGLAGEVSGSLKPIEQWSGLSKYSISIGYEIGVTALQLTAAYAAIINGGYLYKPYVIKYFEDSEGNSFNFSKPKMVRQIISKPVSDELKYFMWQVVEEGTGTKAKISGVKVGGKTGTARKLNMKTKQYSTEHYMSSFIGFAPYDQPRYLCSIIVDEPQTKNYGGEVAAPIFRKIMSRIIHLNQEEPELQDKEDESPLPILAEIKDLPNLVGFHVENALSLLKAKGLKYKISGQGPLITKMTFAKDRVNLERGSNRLKMDQMPRLVGLALREATAKIDLSKINLKVEGNGRVTRQSIAPGTPIVGRIQLTLTCN